MRFRFKLLTLFVCLCCLTSSYATIPAGYYATVDGLSGKALKTAFFNVVKTHTVLSYSDLWTAFRKTDVRADGKVWDVYSNSTNYVFGTDQDTGSGGNVEGTCYNREHSFPNSWFFGDKSAPMYTDLFHLYPTDKWVNGKRGNMPFGDVQVVTGYSANHYSEWGTSTASGSTLTVF
ncbi:MAG: endonuclease, partial [Bacteroidota bacterium]|nr:endonuclease [Bacteroidota bacterium]